MSVPLIQPQTSDFFVVIDRTKIIHSQEYTPLIGENISETALLDAGTPRPYQQDSVDAFAKFSATHFATPLEQRQRRGLVILAPTGSGKGFTLTYLNERLIKRGYRVLVVVHLIELVTDLKGRFEKAGQNVGLIAAGFPENLDAPVQIAMVQTLKGRADRIADTTHFDVVAVDECHHTAANTYSKALAPFGAVVLLGLTATAERNDGKGLGDLFDQIYAPATTLQLLAEGYLVRPRYYVAAQTLKALQSRSSGAEFSEAELMEKYDRANMYSGLIDLYRQHCDGLPCIIFCCNIKHSMKTAEALNAAGYRAAHVDGETPADERVRILAAFKNGQYTHLVNVGLFGEGVDVPGIQCVILNLDTKSFARYAQAVGRGARPTAGFTATSAEQRLAEIAASDKPRFTVLDMGNNIATHGLWEWDRAYSLDSKARTGKKSRALGVMPVRTCHRCGQILASTTRICDGVMFSGPRAGEPCGYVFPTVSDKLQAADFVAVEYLYSQTVQIVPEKKVKLSKRDLWPAHLQQHYHTPAKLTDTELHEVEQAAGYKRGWSAYHIRRRNASKGTWKGGSAKW